MADIHIVIIGAGFAGLTAAKRLARKGCGLGRPLQITLIDRKRRSDFLPLLPDCIGRRIPEEYLSSPLGPAAYQTLFEEVLSLDLKGKTVTTSGRTLSWDYLIIASGTETNFYGDNGFASRAYVLDSTEDAARINQAIRRRDYGNALVCGGGYTGIEVATNLRRRLSPRCRVTIVERAASILGPLPSWMKEYVQDNLRRMDIGLRLETTITRIEGDEVCLENGEIFSDCLCIWAAGVKTSRFIETVEVPKNPQGRLAVDEYLRLREDAFAVGDAAAFVSGTRPLRMAVQFSIKEAETAADNLLRLISGAPLRRFRPRDLGFIVPMANNLSCGKVFGIGVRGRLATCLHYLMCIYRCQGARNRLGVLRALLKDLEAGKEAAMFADLAVLALRVGLGIIFLAHGLQKVFGAFGGPGMKGFTQFLAGLGARPAAFWAYTAGYAEFICGILVLAGIATRAASFVLLVVIVVATALVHLGKGFFLSSGGIEYNLLIACVCFSLMLLGAGRFSIFNRL